MNIIYVGSAGRMEERRVSGVELKTSVCYRFKKQEKGRIDQLESALYDRTWASTDDLHYGWWEVTDSIGSSLSVVDVTLPASIHMLFYDLLIKHNIYIKSTVGFLK